MKDFNKYIRKELTEPELEAFSRKLIVQKFDLEQKKEWAEMLAERHQVERTSSAIRKKKPSRIWLLAAAAAVIALLIMAQPFSQFFSHSNHQELADALLVESKITNPVARKGSTNYSEIRLQLAGAYNQGQYEQAIQLGQSLTQSPKPQLEDHLFLGLSYLYHQQFDNAINALSKAREISQQQARFQEEIQWFLSLAYIKADQLDLAKQELQAIVQAKSWQAEKASHLLNEIK